MTVMTRFEPVPSWRRKRAMRFLVGGNGRGADTNRRAQGLEDLTRRRAERARLWWARRRRQCLAAAMVLESPGRTGMLWYCPLAAPGVEPDALRALTKTIAHRALADGLALVQAIVETDAAADVAMLSEAGYEKLAELIYMRLDLPPAPAAGDEQALTWRSYEQFDEAELANVISATYEGSLDCPALSGLRPTTDVIAGHKVTGIFRPQSWWIVARDGSPVGCVLVNDSHRDATFEVVYIGVVPAFRRRGVARALLGRAAAEARSEARDALTLAVDARNHSACNLYESEGFRVTDRRLAYAMIAREDPGGSAGTNET